MSATTQPIAADRLGPLLNSLVTYAGAHLAQTGVACTHVAILNKLGEIDIHQVADDNVKLDVILGACAQIIEQSGCEGYAIAVHMDWDGPGSGYQDIISVFAEVDGEEAGGIYNVDRTGRQPKLRRRRNCTKEHRAVQALRYSPPDVRH